MNQFRLVLDGTWHNGRRNALTGNHPEKVSSKQKTSLKNCKRDQGGRAKKLLWHDNLCYRPSWTSAKMCHHKLPTAIVDVANTQQRLILHSLFSG